MYKIVDVKEMNALCVHDTHWSQIDNSNGLKKYSYTTFLKEAINDIREIYTQESEV